MPLQFVAQGPMQLPSGTAAQTTAWSAINKGANVGLSPGIILNQVATFSVTVGFQPVFSTVSKSSGKLYVELLAGGSGIFQWGFGDVSSQGTDFIGHDAKSFGQSGASFNANGLFSNVPITIAAAAGDTCGIALDLTAGLAWLAVNNNYDSGVPATGTNAAVNWTPPVALFIAGSSNTNTGTSLTLRCNTAGGQIYSPPSGFSTWDTN